MLDLCVCARARVLYKCQIRGFPDINGTDLIYKTYLSYNKKHITYTKCHIYVNKELNKTSIITLR